MIRLISMLKSYRTSQVRWFQFDGDMLRIQPDQH